MCHYTTTSSFYAILSASGKAMFIDYGSASGVHFGNFERATAATHRIRFQEHSNDRLKREYGLKSVDVAMPSHMHDDHMNGFPHLIRHHNTKVWCYENMVDVFQNPRGYNLGCILGEPFRVARSFKDGETFRWEEFEFEIKHSPGHTEYQMGMFVTIDGKEVAFTGDAFFPNPRNDGAMRHNLVFRNHVENDSHLKSIRNLIEREPATICPGHGQPYPVDRSIPACDRAETAQAAEVLLRSAAGRRDRFRPRSFVGADVSVPDADCAGGIAADHGARAELQADCDESGGGDPGSGRVVGVARRAHHRSSARAKASNSVTVRIAKDWQAPGPRFAIAADVMCDGRYLVQIAEAVVEMKGAFA